MGGFSIWHILIFAIIVLLLFGGNRFSAMMGDVAKGLKSFKQGMADEDDDKMRRYDEQRRNDPPRQLPRDQPPHPIDVTPRPADPVDRRRRRETTKRSKPHSPRMFGVDSSELAVVAILALIFIGPKDLPQGLADRRLLGRPRARHGAPLHFGHREHGPRGRARRDGEALARGE